MQINAGARGTLNVTDTLNNVGIICRRLDGGADKNQVVFSNIQFSITKLE